MRMLFATAAVAALSFAGAAAAAPVTLQPVSYSPEFQTSLQDDLGQREGDILSRDLTTAVSRALAARGATVGSGGLTIELSIVDADPNRPTMHQLSRHPDIDAAYSVSIGGAELHAVIRDASGAVLTEVSHRGYNHSLDDLVGPPTTWTEAHRSIIRFADKVADAYVAQSGR